MEHSSFDENVQMVLDMLPEHDGTENRRKHSLTKADGVWIAHLVKAATHNQGCSIGLTEEQAMAIKSIPASNLVAINGMVKERRKILRWLGAVAIGFASAVGTFLYYVGKMIVSDIDWGKLLHHTPKG